MGKHLRMHLRMSKTRLGRTTGDRHFVLLSQYGKLRKDIIQSLRKSLSGMNRNIQRFFLGKNEGVQLDKIPWGHLYLLLLEKKQKRKSIFFRVIGPCEDEGICIFNSTGKQSLACLKWVISLCCVTNVPW